MKGHIRLFKAESGSKPYTIVAGPDGNMWFTEWQRNKLGVMDIHGNFIHKYPVANFELSPYGIAVSPDGYIWFTGYNFEEPSAVDTVGRMSTDGSFVELYQLNPCACEPLGVTAGADGNMWITEELGAFNGDSYGAVDRVSLDGKAVDRFHMPDIQSLPAWISPGPDGKLWFGQYNAEHHQIGTIDTAGNITNYHVNDAISNTVAATAGPDGRIWFTEGDANDIWHMRPNGTLLQNFPTGVHATPAGITIGPDGNLWFAVAGSGEIGRLHTARPDTRYVLDIASGFVPSVRTARLGKTVEWILEAPGLHGVRDRTGLDLYSSGRQPPVSYLKFTFQASGTYPYRDGATGDRGRVLVPMDAPHRAHVGSPFTVEWATSGEDDPHHVFQVQIRRPGSESWSNLRGFTRDHRARITPNRGGTYRFRARMHHDDGPFSTGWSPVSSVDVR
jgi:streptogramin lyase